MNYGTLAIIDGAYQQPALGSDVPKNRFVGMTPTEDGTLAPPINTQKPGKTTFVVSLNYASNAYMWGGAKNPMIASINVSYSKSFTRLAPGGNPLAAATSFISQFSGCSEARKVRGRAIALSRMHRTISGEEFRFPLEAP